MQVLNYHRPMLGTFHSKFMVVDRKIGIVSSNNIQDNSNMEMVGSIMLTLKNNEMTDPFPIDVSCRRSHR